MAENNRETGLENLVRLPWGTHLCLFFDTQKELDRLLISYFRAGLRNNEACVWITPSNNGNKTSHNAFTRITPEFAPYLKTGQLEIVNHDIYFNNDVFTGDRVCNHMLEKYVTALEKHYDGMRIGGRVPSTNNGGWQELCKYENIANRYLEQARALVLCAYPVNKCRARELIDIFSNHKYVLRSRNGGLSVIGQFGYGPLPEGHPSAQPRYHPDIEDLKAELHQSEEKFNKIARASHEIIIITTFEEGTFIYVNENFTRILGYTREEVTGHTALELNLWKSEKERKEMLKKLDAQSATSNEIFYPRTKTGESVVVRLSAEMHEIYGKKCIISVMTDITRQQQIEEKDRVLTNSAIDGFWITDNKGKIIEVNDSYCRMMGYTRDEILKMSICDIDIDHTPEKALSRLRNCIEHGSEHFRTHHRRKTGEIIAVEINSSFYNIGEGQFFVFIHDLNKGERGEGEESNSKACWRRNITKLQEKFIQEGFEHFQDQEIIELLLSLVMPAHKAARLAERCIKRFLSLGNFLKASPEELLQTGVSPTCVFCIAMLHKLPIKVLQEKIREQSIYDSPQDIFNYLYYSMRVQKNELFRVILLNAKDQIIDMVDLFEGTIDKVAFSTREIIEKALTQKTRTLVFVHNHPSGDPAPSKEDKRLTRDLVFIGKIIGIKTVDHIIIGNNRYYSFAEEGLIKEYELDFLNLKLTGTEEAKMRRRHTGDSTS